jgi:rubredoxin
MSSSDETSPTADGWGYAPIGTDNVPTHCGGYAFDEGGGDWVCDACGAHARTGDIPGWTPRVNTVPVPVTPAAGTNARG